ncbi:5-hydroxytryptamine receptor 3E [Gadus macrocephalus]|uniref:5-hydroxytryptamine receptor 3E n=1 Tax=Gadus macrocephalus TaxID=80720 RepID=UPI0028CBA396|nr:5-hydroxytryptamine receptor 3E [Gadus macrocephalus]
MNYVFFYLCLALMVASLLETILITNLHSSSRRRAPVPRWVRVVFLGTLERLVGLPPMPPKEHSTDPNAAVEEGGVYMNPPGGKHLVDTTLDALRTLGRDVQAIRRQVDRQQRGNHNSEEWTQVAGVIDRFLFWLYAVFIIVSFVGMICIWAFSYSK